MTQKRGEAQISITISGTFYQDYQISMPDGSAMGVTSGTNWQLATITYTLAPQDEGQTWRRHNVAIAYGPELNEILLQWLGCSEVPVEISSTFIDVAQYDVGFRSGSTGQGTDYSLRVHASIMDEGNSIFVLNLPGLHLEQVPMINSWAYGSINPGCCAPPKIENINISG